MSRTASVSAAVPATVLVVAGSDSSGGAGIAADIRTAAALGASVRLAITAVTAQTGRCVAGTHPVPPDMLRRQIEVGLCDGRVGAVKIGMLGNAAAVQAAFAALCASVGTIPIVLDPVLASTSGGRLLDEPGLLALVETLLPVATLLTPNRPELRLLCDRLGVAPHASVPDCAAALLAAGARAVLVKGGHGGGAVAEDLLFRRGSTEPVRFSAPRAGVALRGTGCALSTAIAVHSARGLGLADACEKAKSHLTDLFAAGTERLRREGLSPQSASNIRT